MKYILISNSEYCAQIDDEDYDRLSSLTWRTVYSKTNKCHSIQTTKHGGRSGTISHSMASIIMRQPGKLFDHIDLNPFNNCKSNLRSCTVAQNSMNRSKQKGIYTSIYKGVSWSKHCHKWQARIYFNGRKFNLGLYREQDEAARAYDKAAIEFFKEFANLNFK